MKHTCDVAADELIAFIEEDLPELRMKQLEAHVPDCPTCRAYLAGTRETSELLRETMPSPSQPSRHDMLVRLYQEAEQTTDRPHRGWGQVASLTAVCGTFLLATFLLWSGISQFVDAVPRPFQQASPDLATEWTSLDDEGSLPLFDQVPIPGSIGDHYVLADSSVNSGIRTIVYEAKGSGAVVFEVRQYVADDPEPPGYMERVLIVEETPVYADDPDTIREFRWIHDDIAHHVLLNVTESDSLDAVQASELEQIVQAFLES
jgi:hypothetical protein